MADTPEMPSMSYDQDDGTNAKSPRRGKRDKAEPEQEMNDPPQDPVATKTTPKKASTHRGGFILGTFNDDQINFLNDRKVHMTYGRRIALWLSHSSALYNPQLVVAPAAAAQEKEKAATATAAQEEEEEEKPSLAKAWAFFEHVTLPRYVLPGQDEKLNSKKASSAHYRKETKKKKKNEQHEQHKSQMSLLERIVHVFARGERQLTKAEPGERELFTKLYSPLTTPLSQMGDFGLGYGLYFSTLRYIAMLAFVAGILNLSSLLYFASDEYDSNDQKGVTALLQGSAICTDTTWVPCDSCFPGYFDQRLSYDVDRYVEFFEFLPASDNHWAEKYLNITDYLVWDGIDTFLDDADWEALYANSTRMDEIFTREKFYAPLEEQYGMFFENNAITFQDNTSLPCGSDWVSLYYNSTEWCEDVDQNCAEYYEGYRSSCFYLYSWCQHNNIHQCFLYVDYSAYFSNDTAQYFSNDTAIDFIADLDYVWISLALRNNCEGANFRQGFVSLATVVLIIIGALVIRRRQNRLEEEFDEDEQTAQDYSIAIRNPPEDAYDPTEWKKFFESAFDNCTVRVCTVDVSNDSLIKLLVKRRELLQSLEIQLPSKSFENGKVLEEVEKARVKRNKSLLKCLSAGVPGLYNQLQEVTKELTRMLAEAKDRPTTDAFVTFETEEAQRRVLETLTVGSRAVRTNKIDAFSDPKYLFRGRLVLDVVEPEEPSTIRWQELDATTSQIVRSLIKTSLIALVVLIVCWIVVLFFYLYVPVFASYATTACTTIFPMVATKLMQIEVHKSESSRQTWLFIKVTVFNVAITALLISVYTPFLGTLENKEGSVLGLIPAVHALFFSQLVISPVIQLMDIVGTLKRHILAPRAKTQEGMNMFMLGSQVNLAERYANLMKFIYLMMWFCAIYPAGLFMGSFALFLVYFTDRFSLMRSWARTPQLGTQISDFARNVFTPIAVVIMAVASNYWWSGFPYDNLCLDDRYTIHPGYVGARDVKFNSTNTSFLFGLVSYSKPEYTSTVTIAEDAQNYQFCNQDFRRYSGRSFPAIPKFQQNEWMTEDQTKVSDIYGWFSVAILALVLLNLFRLIGKALFSAYLGGYSPRGRDMKVPYSKCPAIGSYIPQVGSPFFAYPLLLCDISDVDTKIFNWTDPEKEHVYYDVTQDAKELLGDKLLPRHLFGRVKYWPLVAEDLLSVESA